MRVRSGLAILGMAAGLTVTVAASQAQDTKAVYEQRLATMKDLGRNFYGTIGRYLRGDTQYGPEIVTAAENVERILNSVTPAAFAPGSHAAEGSKALPAMSQQPEQVAKALAEAKTKVGILVPAAKSGNKDQIGAAFRTVNNEGCNGCHKSFVKE